MPGTTLATSGSIRDLSWLAVGQGFTLWHYKSRGQVPTREFLKASFWELLLGRWTAGNGLIQPGDICHVTGTSAKGSPVFLSLGFSEKNRVLVPICIPSLPTE